MLGITLSSSACGYAAAGFYYYIFFPYSKGC